MASPTIFNKAKLSGSTNGRGILVAQTATLGTTIHTAVAGTTANTFDEIWLWAWNTTTSSIKLTIEFGNASDTLEQSIPGEGGAWLMVPGWILQNGIVVTAFAGTLNVIFILGYVNEIRP